MTPKAMYQWHKFGKSIKEISAMAGVSTSDVVKEMVDAGYNVEIRGSDVLGRLDEIESRIEKLEARNGK